MKKIIAAFVCLAIFAACKNQSEKIDSSIDTLNQFAVYKYKVSGLNDSIISDSVWKMIFKVEGIEEMLINKDDSSVVVKVLAEKVGPDLISAEINKRGALVLREIQ